MAPRKKATPKEEVQVDIEDVIKPDLDALSSDEGVEAIKKASDDNESEPREEISFELLEEAHAINQELDEAIELEQMCNQSDRDFKRYELVKCLVANDPSISVQSAQGRSQQYIKVADIILNELERREDE